MKKFNTIELFAGCGGFVDGFEKSGAFHTLAAVEWKRGACEVLASRLEKTYGFTDAPNRVLNFDIQRVSELFNGWNNDPEFGSHEGLKSLVGDTLVDVVVGGPPCQAYSIAGRIQDKDGMRNDYRNYLFESYLKVVDAFRPKLIVFENVEGMLSAAPDGEKIVDKIKKGFDQYGYELVENIKGRALLNLAEYEVPQNRKRVILVGVRRDYLEVSGNAQKFLEHFYDSILPRYKGVPGTVKSAVGDLPKLYPGEEYRSGRRKFSHKPESTGINGHIPRFHNKRDIEIFKTLAQDIKTGENRYQKAESLKELYRKKTGRTSNVHKYYVLRWNLPGNTIPAHLKKDGLRHIHPDPEQARSITVREAARLQTFDDDFEFTEKPGQDYEMIGNAVPPLFSYKLAGAVKEFMNSLDSFKKA